MINSKILEHILSDVNIKFTCGVLNLMVYVILQIWWFLEFHSWLFVSGQNSFELIPNSDNSWLIQTRKSFDRDVFESEKFARPNSISVECIVENRQGTKRTVTKDILVEILDEDDNAPQAQEKRLDIIFHNDRVFKVGLNLIYGFRFVALRRWVGENKFVDYSENIAGNGC